MFSIKVLLISIAESSIDPGNSKGVEIFYFTLDNIGRLILAIALLLIAWFVSNRIILILTAIISLILFITVLFIYM
jgi:membrane protein YdbS with pleckstrin-like domain